MTENQWWSRKIQPIWHNPLNGWVARKVQDLVNKGAPDIDACFKGTAVKVELKYCPSIHLDPAHVYTFSTYAKKKTDPDMEKPRASVVSREQFRNLDEWDKAGGKAYILVGIDTSWYLINFKNLDNAGMTLGQLSDAASLRGDIAQIRQVPTWLEGKDWK